MTKLILRKSVGSLLLINDATDGIMPQYTFDMIVADLPCAEKSLKSSIGLVDKI